MTPPLLIGIMGRKRHGKDTFAARLVEGHGFVRLAFADALKESALVADPIITWTETLDPYRLSDVVGVVGWEEAKANPEVRRFLQHYGEGMRDHVHADVWVDAVRLRAEGSPSPVVVTDVRFPNEAEWITRAGGTLVRVRNPRVPEPEDEHVSETALDGWPAAFYVENGGTIADLHSQADLVLRMLHDLERVI